MSSAGAIRRSHSLKKISSNAYTRVKKKNQSKKNTSWLLFWFFTLFTSVVFIAMLSVALLYSYRYLTQSEFFAVRDVRVAGNVRLGSGEIIHMAELAPGMNSLAVRMDAVETKLLRNPWVEAVSVKRELPGTFYVTIRERIPQYWVRKAGSLSYADAAGNSISPVEPGKFVSLPMLVVEPGMEPWQERLPDMVGQLESSGLPLDVNSAAWVRLTRSRGMELFLENVEMTLRIGVEDWTMNLNRLARVLDDLKTRGELKDVRDVQVVGTSVWVRERASGPADS